MLQKEFSPSMPICSIWAFEGFDDVLLHPPLSHCGGSQTLLSSLILVLFYSRNIITEKCFANLLNKLTHKINHNTSNVLAVDTLLKTKSVHEKKEDFPNTRTKFPN